MSSYWSLWKTEKRDGLKWRLSLFRHILVLVVVAELVVVVALEVELVVLVVVVVVVEVELDVVVVLAVVVEVELDVEVSVDVMVIVVTGGAEGRVVVFTAADTATEAVEVLPIAMLVAETRGAIWLKISSTRDRINWQHLHTQS